MGQTAICRLLRVYGDTVGRCITRVMGEWVDVSRPDDLFEIGVDEVSWWRHHKLTLVSDHRRGRLVWGREGKDAEALDRFFAELGPERATQITAVSMYTGHAFEKLVRAAHHGHCRHHGGQCARASPCGGGEVARAGCPGCPRIDLSPTDSKWRLEGSLVHDLLVWPYGDRQSDRALSGSGTVTDESLGKPHAPRLVRCSAG